jgi:hypothetical protein
MLYGTQSSVTVMMLTTMQSSTLEEYPQTSHPRHAFREVTQEPYMIMAETQA